MGKTITFTMMLLAAVASTAAAQTYSSEHAQSLILLGNGTDITHTLTLQAPTLTTSPSITLPAASLTFPASNAAGVLTNDGFGGLTWGSAFTNPMSAPGDMIYGGASGAATRLAATATANQVLLSGANSAPSWSTATYPATTTINQLLYSSAGNTIAGLPTANYGVLNTSSGGVPSITASPTISGTVQIGVRSGGTNPATGAVAFANSSSTNLTTIQAGNANSAVTYTLPTDPPSANGQVLTATTGGVMSWGASPSIIVGGSAATNVAASSYNPGATQNIKNGTVSVTQGNLMVVPRSGTIDNLYVAVGSAPGNNKTITFTIVDNTTSTSGPAASITGNSSTTGSDVSTALTVSAGDHITMTVTASSGTGFSPATWSFELK